MRATVILIPVLLSCLLQVAIGADLRVSEIRFESITGYGHERFTLRIRSDGSVEYVGKDFVAVKGRQRSTISLDDFKRLVRKIEQIGFFRLEHRYDRFQLDQSPKSRGNEASAERTIVTDQPTQIITVVARDGTKTVEDYMGPPKGLYELEELIIDVTHAPRWIGASPDLHDIPYYESFPLNRQVTFRTLLEHYRTSGDPKRVSGYLLTFMKNTMDFNLQAPGAIDLSRLDGYIVDATGYIKQKSKLEYVFVAIKIRPVRRYLSVQSLSY
jgi:hypothetical protein